MVHRINEKEANPNPHINFITALPGADDASQEDGRQLLLALAAQARPVMKTHGFAVNSLEEVSENRCSVPGQLHWASLSLKVRIQRGISRTQLEQR
jgi:hypothetical protein